MRSNRIRPIAHFFHLFRVIFPVVFDPVPQSLSGLSPFAAREPAPVLQGLSSTPPYKAGARCGKQNAPALPPSGISQHKKTYFSPLKCPGYSGYLADIEGGQMGSNCRNDTTLRRFFLESPVGIRHMKCAGPVKETAGPGHFGKVSMAGDTSNLHGMSRVRQRLCPIGAGYPPGSSHKVYPV